MALPFEVIRDILLHLQLGQIFSVYLIVETSSGPLTECVFCTCVFKVYGASGQYFALFLRLR